jgi:peptide/nickel transport system substrate-binding protein
VEKGKADLALDAHLASPAVLGGLKTQHASRLELTPTAGTFYFVFNTRSKPFDDVRARRAVNYAVDRNRLLGLAGPDVGQVTCQVLPPNFAAYRPYCPYTVAPGPAGTYSGPDLAKARALVAASGTKGEKVVVWGTTRLEPAGGDYLVSVLDELGYKASYHAVDHVGDVLAALSVGDKAQVGGSGWFADYASPSGFFIPALSCKEYTPGVESSNAGDFCDPRIDRQMARARALETTSPEAASRLWSQIDREVVDQAAWVPWLNPRDIEFLSERLGNYQYNPEWGTLLDQLWVNSS